MHRTRPSVGTLSSAIVPTEHLSLPVAVEMSSLQRREERGQKSTMKSHFTVYLNLRIVSFLHSPWTRVSASVQQWCAKW